MKENFRRAMKIWLRVAVFAVLSLDACGQAPGVPIYESGQTVSQMDAALAKQIEALRLSGKTLTLEAARDQLHRSSCRLELPKPKTAKLNSRAIWEIARQSHIRVGWSYLCTTCEDWHLNLAGGYALTKDGVIATCHHVVRPLPNMRQGYLVAADEAGNVFPVSEILAANRYSDACILKINGAGFTPLPLNTNVFPGDAVYCFSNPQGLRGYFSQGIVNRFLKLPERRLPNEPGAPFFAPTRIDVSADWSTGSSGAPVLDEFGNAIGHVSTMSNESDNAKEVASASIVFHEAISARDVMALVKSGK